MTDWSQFFPNGGNAAPPATAPAQPPAQQQQPAPAPAAQAGTDFFEQMAQAGTSFEGDYFEADCFFIVSLDGIEVKPSENPLKRGVQNYIVKTTVVGTNAPGVMAGDKRSWVTPLSGEDYKMRDANTFAKVIATECGQAEQPLANIHRAIAQGMGAGTLFLIRTTGMRAKNGNPWTKHEPRALTPEEKAKAAQMQAAAE